MSLDFQLLNILGFTCYGLYNVLLYFSTCIRDEYADQHDGLMPAVHLNDVFFALHAVVLTLITLVQCCIYERGDQKLSRATIFSVSGVVIGAVVWAVGIWASVPIYCSGAFHWLTWLYFLSFVKMGVNLVKYVPQVSFPFFARHTTSSCRYT